MEAFVVESVFGIGIFLFGIFLYGTLLKTFS